MQLIVVDENKSRSIVSRLDYCQMAFDILMLDSGNRQNAYEIANKINEMVDNEDNVIFLNSMINYLPERHPWYGVEILREIRGNSFFEKNSKIQKSHVVFYSPLDPVQFVNIDSETFLIAISPRVTYQKYTHDPRKLNLDKLLHEKLTNLAVLKSYFTPSCTSLFDRHAPSNLWAAWQFFRQFEKLFPSSGKEYLRDINKFKTKLLRDRRLIYDITFSEMSTTDISSLRKRLINARKKLTEFTTSNKRIVLIDDQANEIAAGISWGWKDIYSLLLGGDISEVQALDITNDDDEILNSIDYSVGCILLDLHLDISDSMRNAKRVRGVILLNKIRQSFPYIPIIITTASNKSRQRKILRNARCDSYWIKEGIDESMNRVASFNNFLQLIRMVGKVFAPEYHFLNKSVQKIQKYHKKTMWWENHHKNSNTLSVSKVNVLKLLDHALLVFHNHLQYKLFGEGRYSKKNQEIELKGLIIQLSTIFEFIHTLSDSISLGSDSLHTGIREHLLHKSKNLAIGYNSLQCITTKDFQLFFSSVLDFLSSTPLKEQNKNNSPQVLNTNDMEENLSTNFND